MIDSIPPRLALESFTTCNFANLEANSAPSFGHIVMTYSHMTSARGGVIQIRDFRRWLADNRIFANGAGRAPHKNEGVTRCGWKISGTS
jgi:hypothetical protein